MITLPTLFLASTKSSAARATAPAPKAMNVTTRRVRRQSIKHRLPACKFTVFDPPNAWLTEAVCINNGGDIAGWFYLPGRWASQHGFVRARNGNFTTFGVPNAYSTDVKAINNAGDVAGSVFEMLSLDQRAFVRDRSGDLIVFDASDTGSTIVVSMNDRGDVV